LTRPVFLRERLRVHASRSTDMRLGDGATAGIRSLDDRFSTRRIGGRGTCWCTAASLRAHPLQLTSLSGRVDPNLQWCVHRQRWSGWRISTLGWWMVPIGIHLGPFSSSHSSHSLLLMTLLRPVAAPNGGI
ncbi:hypothetical protein PFISCL1PPCAC_439, partial [Pristionchus fissidentatus]